MHGPAPVVFLVAFGVTAALLLVGGLITLRFQRNRFRFLLIQAGLEKGINPLAGSPPLWFLSLRRGTMTLAVGAVLILVGIAVGGSASNVPMPSDAEVRALIPTTALSGDLPEGGMPSFRPIDSDGGPRGPGGPMGLGGPMGPGGSRGPGGGFPPRFDHREMHEMQGPPPRELPAVEAWHRAQDRKMLAGLSATAGLILAVLGLARLLFALAERRYADSGAASMV